MNYAHLSEWYAYNVHPARMLITTGSFCYSEGMLKFKFGKLVRDKIVDHQLSSGAKPKHYILDDLQHKRELVNKISEEAQEIIHASSDNIASEIADVQQAIDDLKEKFGISHEDVANAQQAKLQKNGAFKNGVFLEYVEVQEDDDWVEYYRSNADRYPEIKD